MRVTPTIRELAKNYGGVAAPEEQNAPAGAEQHAVVNISENDGRAENVHRQWFAHLQTFVVQTFVARYDQFSMFMATQYNLRCTQISTSLMTQFQRFSTFVATQYDRRCGQVSDFFARVSMFMAAQYDRGRGQISAFFSRVSTFIGSHYHRSRGQISAFFTRVYAWLCLNFYAWLCLNFFNFNTWLHSKISKDKDKNKNKWFTSREIATFAPVLFSAIFSLTSMKFPQEKETVQRTRGYILWALSLFYMLSHFVKIAMDYTDDHAKYLYYNATDAADKKVFYYKSVQHIVGLLMFVMSSTVSLYTCFYQDTGVIYKMSIVSGVMTVVYAACQAYKSHKYPAIVDVSNGQKWGHPLQVCDQFPPRGRFVWYEREAPPAERILIA